MAAVKLLQFTGASPDINTRDVFRLGVRLCTFTPSQLELPLEMSRWLGTPEAMSVAQNLCTCKIGWGDFGDENPDKLIETRAKVVLEKSVLELLSKVLHIHCYSER